PFIEICTTDSATFRVNVYDGSVGGNQAPKRSFGWNAGLADATGIGTDGTNVYIASRYTNSIGVWTRTGMTGNITPHVGTLSLTGQPTALWVDAANAESFVAVGNTIYVYDTSALNSTSAKRTLATGFSEGISALAFDATHSLLIAAHGNHITLYTRT